MKSMNQKEMANFVSRLKSLEGFTLNAVHSDSPILILEFYSKKEIQFLMIDMKPSQPIALLFANQLPFKIVKQPKPISLFLKAHFVGKSLKSVEFNQDKGRLFKLNFTNDGIIEIRLFPHGQNIIAFADKKQISWSKPKPLVLNNLDLDLDSLSVRAEAEIKEEWLSLRNKSAQKNSFIPEEELKKQKIKLEKAILKVSHSLKEQEDELKIQMEKLENISSPMISEENLSQIYENKKRIEKKIIGQKTRINELLSQKKSLNLDNIKKIKKAPLVPPNVKEIKSKRWTLPSGVTVAIGRNAKENTDLLRKSKPWDIWLHLKDFPGAYGFVFRKKNQKISKEDLNVVSLWVAKMSLKNKWETHLGEKVSLVLAECRYVQAIKGDKLGRVTFKNAKTLVITLR